MRFLSVKKGDVFSKTYDLTAAKLKLGRITMGSGIPKGKSSLWRGFGGRSPLAIFFSFTSFSFLTVCFLSILSFLNGQQQVKLTADPVFGPARMHGIDAV